jgi:PAP2 superfamily protein
MRQALALMFAIYAVVLETTAVRHGDVGTMPLFLLMLAIALFVGRGGSFVFYFVPFFLGLFSYVLAGGAVSGFALPVHYTPQIDVEKWLTPGPIPTVWLQEHLYDGRTGGLEVFAVAMYVTHFMIPLALGFFLAVTRRGRAFAALMFGLLAVSILGVITFVLVPTAPPWLAAQEGYLPGVHHILKQSLFDVHLTKLAELIGNSASYDTTAAIPSLHTAFPLVCLLASLRYRLPTPLSLALALNVLAVVFTIVYTGEHYLIDAIAGGAYALVAVAIVDALFSRSKDPVTAAGPVAEAAARTTSAAR